MPANTQEQQTSSSLQQKKWSVKIAAAFCLCLTVVSIYPAYSDPPYQRTPRIPPRSDNRPPQAWPLLEAEEAAQNSGKHSASPTSNQTATRVQNDERVQEGLPPELEPGYVPVNYQPMEIINPVSDKVPADSKDLMNPTRIEPEKDTTAESTSKSSNHKPIHKKKVATRGKNKPVVHFPEALMPHPEADTAILSQNSSNAEQAAVVRQEAGPPSQKEDSFQPVSFQPSSPEFSSENSGQMLAGFAKEALLHYNRASYYGGEKQWEKAIQEYEKALTIQPNLADAYVGLSSVYAIKNQWEDALSTAKQALASNTNFIKPENRAQAQYNLSLGHCLADDVKQARKYYQQAQMAQHPQISLLAEFIEKNCKP